MKNFAFIAAIAVAGVANAQVFNDLTAFNTALSDSGQFVNNLNGFANGPSIPVSFSGGTPTMSYGFSADGGLYTNGDFVGVNIGNRALVITFTSGNVRAFGGNLYSTDISDVFQAGITINVAYSDGFTDSYVVGSTSEFRGYVSNTVLTSATITAAGAPASRFVSVDNLRTSAVPEPASMTALALGLAAIARRRKNA
jgi:hypothetical protein